MTQLSEHQCGRWMQTNNKLVIILIRFKDDVIFNIYIYNFICIIIYK